MLSNDWEEYFEHLNNDFFDLRVDWRFYRSLFGTNKETVDMLNEISGPTAYILEKAFFERTLLGLRKLTDPLKAGKRARASVSIRGLVEFSYLKEDTELANRIERAAEAASFARDWGNKKIAHSDLKYRSGAYQLEPASRRKVEDAMDAIAAVLKWVARVHKNTALATHPIPPLNDERQFLRALYEGNRYLKKLKERWEQAAYAADSLTEEEMDRKLANIPAFLRREDPPLDIE